MINVKQVYTIEDKAISDIVMGLTEGEYEIIGMESMSEIYNEYLINQTTKIEIVVGGFRVTIEGEKTIPRRSPK